MSSLFHKHSPYITRFALLLPLVAIGAAGTALGADGYFIPEVEAGGIHQTNPEWATENPSSATGYLAYAGGIFGVRSPRNITEFRPRVEYYDYSSRPELRNINGYADLNSHYSSLRGEWTLIASYSRENSYNAQQTSAEYDQFDPNDPTVDSTGRITLLSEVSTRIQARPSFSYRFSERFGTEVNLFYQTMDSNTDAGGSIVDYRDASAQGSLFWNWSPQTMLAAGVYGANYRTDDGSNVTTGQGVSFMLDKKWSETYFAGLAFNVEKTKVELTGLPDDTSTTWGGEFNFRRKWQLGDLRLNMGRTFGPSSGGARTALDQVRLQYYRNFSPRWTYLVAVRGFRNRVIGGVTTSVTSLNRDYATGYLQLNWEMTRTWYLTGAYSHYWQQFVGSGATSRNDVLTLGIGYRGLGPPGRDNW